MRKLALLLILALVAPALCWWPIVIEPNLHLPWWLPFAELALFTSLATILSNGRWPLFPAATGIGTAAGLSILGIWWPTDGIARTYLFLAIPIATLAATLVSLAADMLARLFMDKVSGEHILFSRLPRSPGFCWRAAQPPARQHWL